MGILEQLRDESNKKQAQDCAQLNLEQQLATNYEQLLLPKMQQAFQFMKEIVEHLNYLEQAIKVKNYSDRYTQLGDLLQTDYKINTDGYIGFVDPSRLMQINVTFYCLGEGHFAFKREGKTAIEQEVAFLSQHNLTFDWKYVQTVSNVATAIYKVQRRVPVRFRLEVDYEQSKINLLINNHTNFDAYKRSLSPEAVDQNLLDDIARYMLRKDNQFVRLEISEHEKQAIKLQVKQQHREQQALLQKIQQEEQQARDNAHLLSRLNPLKRKK